jgi:hypothetical protein
VVAEIALAALAAALIVFSRRFFALDAVVAILVLLAAVAAAAAHLVQAFRGRVELGVLRQPLHADLRPHLLQFLNYALLAALILIAHPPFPLHRAGLRHADHALLTAAGVPAPTEAPVGVLWSPGLDARVGRPARVPQPRTG